MNRFKLYWLNERTGDGFPSKDYPGDYTYDEAFAIINPTKRHPQYQHYRLRMEPFELHEKYTSKYEAV